MNDCTCQNTWRCIWFLNSPHVNVKVPKLIWSKTAYLAMYQVDSSHSHRSISAQSTICICDMSFVRHPFANSWKKSHVLKSDKIMQNFCELPCDSIVALWRSNTRTSKGSRILKTLTDTWGIVHLIIEYSMYDWNFVAYGCVWSSNLMTRQNEWYINLNQ